MRRADVEVCRAIAEVDVISLSLVVAVRDEEEEESIVRVVSSLPDEEVVAIAVFSLL